MRTIIKIFGGFLLACVAIGIILGVLGFILRYLTIPLICVLIILIIIEFVKGKRRDKNLIITYVIFIPVLFLGFLGGGKLLNWLNSSNNEEQPNSITSIVDTSESSLESKNETSHEEANVEEGAMTSENSIDTITGEIVESKQQVILGATRDEVINMFSDYEIDENYEKKVDANAIKFVNDNLLIVVDFDTSGKAEGVAFLSNNFWEITDISIGVESYVNQHYDELVSLATGNKEVKIETNRSSEYPIEVYIGNIH